MGGNLYDFAVASLTSRKRMSASLGTAYKPLVPTRTGEAPVLAAQRRRYAAVESEEVKS